MRNNIKEILYIKKESFGQSEYLKIEINENKNIIKYSINNKSNIIEVDNTKIETFIERLFRTIDNWEKTYTNNNVIDGSLWQLKIIFNNNIQKNYFGENSFPINFEHFIKIKNELLK